MPKTIETVVYTFDELSDRAKDHARDWYRQAVADDFNDFHGESVLEDATRIGLLIGIDLRTRPVRLMNGKTRQEPNVYWSLDRDRGLTFGGSYSYVQRSTRLVSTECPATWINRETGETTTSKPNEEVNRIARELYEIQRRHFYKLHASIGHGRSRDFRLDVSVDCDHCHIFGQNDECEDAETARELLRDFADWILSNLEREYEYQNSDEQVDESIRANEYTFTEDGRRKG